MRPRGFQTCVLSSGSTFNLSVKGRSCPWRLFDRINWSQQLTFDVGNELSPGQLSKLNLLRRHNSKLLRNISKPWRELQVVWSLDLFFLSLQELFLNALTYLPWDFLKFWPWHIHKNTMYSMQTESSVSVQQTDYFVPLFSRASWTMSDFLM